MFNSNLLLLFLLLGGTGLGNGHSCGGDCGCNNNCLCNENFIKGLVVGSIINSGCSMNVH